jgi:hypothetical protein
MVSGEASQDMSRQHPPDLRLQMELTGLSYADWEREAIRLQHVAERSAATGFLDTQHLGRAEQIDEAIADEIEVVEDVTPLMDEESAGQLAGIRDRLAALRQRVHDVTLRMRRLAKSP